MFESNSFTTGVIIVGAGIGGMTAAVALRQEGFQVLVLEQAQQLGEIGAGLQIGPNASRVLYSLGLRDKMTDIALVTQESVRRRWETGEILTKTSLGAGAVEEYGSPYLHLHRADLHRILVEAAVDPDRDGPVVEIRTSSRIVSVDASAPHPHLITESGEEYSAPVIIGADGINSVVRQHLDKPNEVHFSGDMAYRALIPADRLMGDARTRWLFDWPAANFWLGEDRHLVVYPVRNMEFVNIVAVVPISDKVREHWRSSAPRTEMLSHYQGWDDRVVALLEHADEEIMAWALNYQEPFPSWHEGRIALLGDACHAMVPYFSQGASQAIEDAAVLAEELADVEDAGIPLALKTYSTRRAEHAGVVQNGALGNRELFHLPDGLEQQHRDAGFREQHKESGVSFDWIYHGSTLKCDMTPEQWEQRTGATLEPMSSR